MARERTIAREAKLPNIREYLVASLKDGWKRFRKRLKRCQKEFSEKAVHNSRIESRRLLSTCELMGALFSNGQAEKARRNLKRYLDTFDELRDTHVQLIFTGMQVSHFPELRDFRETLRKRERRCIKQTARRIKRIKLSPLRRSIRAMEEELCGRGSGSSATRLRLSAIVRVLRQAFARVMKLHRLVDPSDTTTIHRVRVAFKKLRYTIEAVAPLLPGATRQKLEALRKFQSLMGEIQDVEVVLSIVKRFTPKRTIELEAAQKFVDHLERRRQRLVVAYVKRAHQLDRFRPQSFTSTPVSRTGQRL